MLKTLTFLTIFLSSFIVQAQSVVDNGAFFSISERSKIETQIDQITKRTTVCILLYTIDTLNGKSTKEYGMELGYKFQLGKKGINNAIIILLSKKDGELQILNGYGLEWVLTDDESKIVTNEMVQFFRKKEFYNGVETSLNLIDEKVSKLDWEFKETELEKVTKSDLGKILKFEYTNTSGKTSYKYAIDTDPQFSEDFKILLQSGEQKFELYYSKYMNEYIGTILTKKEITIYARLKDWDLKKLELLGIE
jgi:hypothetical protein